MLMLGSVSMNVNADLKPLTDDELSKSSGKSGITVGYIGDYKADIGFQLGDSGGVLNIDQKISAAPGNPDPALKIDFEGSDIVITPIIQNVSIEAAIQVGSNFDMQTQGVTTESAGEYGSTFLNANKSNLIGISKISNFSLEPGTEIRIRAH